MMKLESFLPCTLNKKKDMRGLSANPRSSELLHTRCMFIDLYHNLSRIREKLDVALGEVMKSIISTLIDPEAGEKKAEPVFLGGGGKACLY